MPLFSEATGVVTENRFCKATTDRSDLPLSLSTDIEMLENVQRRFTKRIPGMFNLTYHQRLVALDLESLEIRRLRFDLLLTYKILFGLIGLNTEVFFCLNDSRNKMN